MVSHPEAALANYMTNMGDKQILFEAPASGAFSKSDLEVTPDPLRALENIIGMIRDVSMYTGQQIAPALARTGAAMELRFAVRADAFGLVMLSESPDMGQFQVTLKLVPQRPRPPASPPPASRED